MVTTIKIQTDNGYQIVVGGRLVTERRGDSVIPHPELPAYEIGMFPGNFDRWLVEQTSCVPETEHVRVYAYASGTWREIGPILAQRRLVPKKPASPDEVRSEIRKQAGR